LHAFSPKTGNTVKNITSKLNHPSLSKRSTGCIRQDIGMEHSTCFVLAKSVTVLVAVLKSGSCSLSSLHGVKVNEQYYWDILLSQ